VNQKTGVKLTKKTNEVETEVPTDGTITLTKTSSDPSATSTGAHSLAGATYGIYSNESCTAKVGELVTDAAGKAGPVSLTAGTYWVKETSPSKGFGLDSAVKRVVLAAGATVDVKSTEPLSKGGIGLQKKDADL
jgi:uncharacterized surface anchored protein